MPRIRNASRTPLTWAVLALFLAAVPALAMGDDDEKTPDFNKLRRALRVAYGQANYTKALELAEKMHEIRPDDLNTFYNIACFHCLLGDKDKSYTWLGKAIEAGYRDADSLVNDYDFRTMRGEDRFRALIRRMRADSKVDEPEQSTPPAKVEKPKKPAKAEKPKKPAKAEKPAKPKKADAPELTPQQHGEKIGELTRKLIEVSGKGEHKQALKLALEALSHAKALHEAVGEQADPALSLTHYNVACVYSLLKKKEPAFKHLDAAIKAGASAPGMADQIEGDADFKNIRKDPRFAKAIAQARQAGGDDDDDDDEADEDDGDDDEDAEAEEDAGGDEKKTDLSAADFRKAITDLTNKLVAASDKGERAEALAFALAAVEQADQFHKAVGEQAHPSLSLTHYNAACMYSLVKQTDLAFDHLEKAVAMGGWGMDLGDLIRQDADFDNIRKDPRFEKILAKAGRAGGDGEEDDEADDDDDEDDEDTAAGGGDQAKDAGKLSPNEHGQKIGELTAKLLDISGEGRRAEALKIALEALSNAEALHDAVGDGANPALSLTHYNVACMFSLMKKNDEAFDHLDKAIEAGGFDRDLVEQIEGDADFENIRKDPRYAEAIARAGKSKAPSRSDAPSGEKRVEFEWKVTLPSRFDKSKPAPLLVALHHYNGSMNQTAARWKKAADEVGAILLTPQGTIKLEEGEYHWGRSLDTIEENVLDAIDIVLDRYKVDEDQIILAGFSQGGWATWGLALRNPDTFCGIIPVAGLCEIEADVPLEADEIEGLRVFIMIGADESPDLIASNRTAANRLRKLGAEVDLVTYKGVGHGFPRNETEEMLKALRFILED